jgi:hypothetical protein
VTGPLQRQIKVLCAAAIAGWITWMWISGTALDRTAFTAVARGFANPPLFITGEGSHSNPWKLRTFASSAIPRRDQSPVIVSLGDDLEGFFQSSPPSPIDLAVILTNFQRLGSGKAATATVLAWDSPDPIGLAALDKAIGRFDSLVMAAPLSRGAVPESMPPAFRKASIPLSAVQGDTSLISTVNRIPLTGVILGKENTLAGFQSLDLKTDPNSAPMIARWEDRVVFAFPLLVVLQQRGLGVDGVEIRLGEFLKLSSNGPTVPIDPSGRLAVPHQRISPRATIPAESLIDGADDLFPKPAAGTIILRDDRSAAEPSTRAFSKNLPGLIATIASDAGLTRAREFKRMKPVLELATIALVAFALAAFCNLPAFARNILFALLASAGIVTQCLFAAIAAIWLPGLPVFSSITLALLVSSLIPIVPYVARPSLPRSKVPKKKPIPEPIPIQVSAEPAKKPPAKPKPKSSRPDKVPPKSETPKTPPSKKTPAKKAPAKKKRKP